MDYDENELLPACPADLSYVRPTYNDLRIALQRIKTLEGQVTELASDNARLRSQQSLLGVLRELAMDPAVPPHLRLKAAEAGVSYETPRLSATMLGVGNARNWGDQLDAAKARRDRFRVIEGD